MFRRLKERLAEELEATRFPGAQHVYPGGRATDPASRNQEETSTEDLITLSDSPSVVVPHTSPQQFSIGDDDGFPSETSTPQRKQAGNSDLSQYHTPDTSAGQHGIPLPEVQNILPTYTPSKRSYYVPQSDIESEVEEPPTLKLDGISIDQVSATNEVLKAKLYKYKEKYIKIVQAYKEMLEEKKKIEHTLTECQDKALRRIAELKEQCHLEQKAKAHLEENLRIYLEEKEELINVLQTKIQLLKEGRNVDAPEISVKEKEDLPAEDNKSEDSNSSGHAEDENLMLKDKIKKLQALLEKCKETIVNNKEQMTCLMKERESISQMLETKTKEFEEMKERGPTQSELETKVQGLQSRLAELEQQQAESAMSMAETKKNMHEELEIKEQQLSKAKEDIKQLQHAVDHERHLSAETKKQHEETIEKLQNKLKITEKMMEEEKQNLMQELSRGKAAAVALMQQECAKKLYALEAEWKDKLKDTEAQNERILNEKINEIIFQKEAELQNLHHECEKQRLTVEELERQNEKLSEAIESCTAGAVHEHEFVEKMNSVKADFMHDTEEKNVQISNLECSKVDLYNELNDLKIKSGELQNEVGELQQNIVCLKEELRCSESVICEKETEIRNCHDMMQNIEENLKNTFSFALSEAKQLSLELHIHHEGGNPLSQLLFDNDNIIKLMFENNKELRKENNTLLKEKEVAECNLSMMINSVSEIKETLSGAEVHLKASKEQCAELKNHLREKVENIIALQEAQQLLEAENSEFFRRYKELEEKAAVLEQNQNLFKELECRLEEETEKAIENATKHKVLLNSFLKMVHLLDSELQQNVTEKVGENQENHVSCQNVRCCSFGGPAEYGQCAQDLIPLCNKLEQKLNERVAEIVLIRKQVKDYENEINHLKREIQKFEKISEDLQEKLQATEHMCSQLSVEKESCSSEKILLQSLLTATEEKVAACQSDVQKLNSVLEEVNFERESLQKENTDFAQEINLLQGRIAELKCENENLNGTIEVMRNTYDSKITSFVTEISDFQQALTKTQEERNNLSAVLMSIEQEIDLNKKPDVSDSASELHESLAVGVNSMHSNFPNGNLEDKEYVKRIEEMKILIKDLQYRETEQNNLLEKIRSDYENQTKQINMKVQDEIKTLNALTERSSNELKHLREQFAFSQKEYEEKIENLNNKLNLKSEELVEVMEDCNHKAASITLMETEVRSLQNTLTTKEAMLSVLSQDKSDLESKVVEMKEKYEQQEYELKSDHNRILTNLRDQTKQTIDKLNRQIKELTQMLEDQESKHEVAVLELVEQHHSEIEEMKSKICKLEADCRSVANIEEKLQNMKCSLEEMKLQLEETNLQKEKEVESKLSVQEESREWETKFKSLSVQMLSASATHMEECASLQTLIDQKEVQIEKYKQKITSVNWELQTLRSNLNILAEEFLHSKQGYELQMQDVVKSIKDTEVLTSNLLQRLSRREIALAKKTAAFHKVKEECEGRWKKSIANVREKFIGQIKNQHEKHKIKLQELQLLSKEHADLKRSLEEKDSCLALKEETVQENCAQVVLKEKQNESLRNIISQKEETLVHVIEEKENLLNILAHTENENTSLKQVFTEFQEIYKSYAADELTPAAFSSCLSAVNAKCRAYENKFADLKNMLSTLRSDFSGEIEAKDRQIEKIRNELNNVLIRSSNLESECKVLQDEICSLKEFNRIVLEEKEKDSMDAKEKILNLKSSLFEANKQCSFLEAKLKNFEDEFSEREKGYWEKISNLSAESEKIHNEKILVEGQWKKKISDLKKKAEMKLMEIKEGMGNEKHEALMSAELAYKEELQKLTEKVNVLKDDKKDCEKRKLQEVEEMKKQIEELRNELKLQMHTKAKELEQAVLQKSQLKNDCSILQESVKDKENIIIQLQSTISSLENEKQCKMEELSNRIKQLKLEQERHEALLLEKSKLQNDCSILHESVKDKENIVLQLRSSISSLENDSQCKMEELSCRIKQLELEREHLMLQAQERVAATEAKCRESSNSLAEKISELESKDKEIENLKLGIEKLNSQLDESLIVAEANQSAAAQELYILKEHLNASQSELEGAIRAHSLREAELLSQVKSLEEEKLCLGREKRNLDTIEAEKVELLEKIQTFERKIENETPILQEIHSIREENAKLQQEVDSLVALRKDNEMLIAQVHSLESNEKDLHEKLNQLEVTNAELRTSISDNVKQTSNISSDNLQKELTLLQEENNALLDKVHVLEESISTNSDTSFKEYVDLIKKDYEGKLSAKEAEMETKLKQIVKDFAAQMNVKEKDYDEILSQVLEKSQNQEGKLLREHRLEIASLRQEIFEKDCALEEMHDHYEEILKEKDAKLMELEKRRAVSSSIKSSSEPTSVNNETSDWDDRWVECEENCDSASPIHSNKGDCGTHLQQIHMLQEELEKCNSEIKDLRVLLRLSPPQSLASNSDSQPSSLLLPEPTEFEYLKNILFEYMMGKEPLTLAKVIAAVLRFSDEQTKLVLKKEELKQTMKTHWLGLNS